MGAISTRAPEGATTFTNEDDAATYEPETLSLELIANDLESVEVFAQALEHFICEVQSLDMSKDSKEAYIRSVCAVDIMALEIKRRVREMRSSLSDFIDAAPFENLWAERTRA